MKWQLPCCTVFEVSMYHIFLLLLLLLRFFGEEPPPPSSSINWNVDKKPLALQLLSLCCVSLNNDMATPFQLCAIILPKLVRNLDSMSFSDQDKLKLTMDILNITQGTYMYMYMICMIRFVRKKLHLHVNLSLLLFEKWIISNCRILILQYMYSVCCLLTES